MATFWHPVNVYEQNEVKDTPKFISILRLHRYSFDTNKSDYIQMPMGEKIFKVKFYEL